MIRDRLSSSYLSIEGKSELDSHFWFVITESSREMCFVKKEIAEKL
ncbi:hypothetical protein HMPREF1508_1609 [Shuttleworthella sp. MSX8B]|nr:hypothetical protein HMPREF1508_1609 [Shuttleworthia sp. MSX8B]